MTPVLVGSKAFAKLDCDLLGIMMIIHANSQSKVDLGSIT